MAFVKQILAGVTLSSHVMPSGYGSGHAHPAYQIGNLEGGRGHTFCRGAHQTLVDELIVFDSDEPHGGRMIGDAGWLRRTFLDVEPFALQRISSAVADKPVEASHFSKLSVPDLLETFVDLFADIRGGLSMPN